MIMKKWPCEHIEPLNGVKGQVITWALVNPFMNHVSIPHNWDICPVAGCHSGRPIGRHDCHFMSFKGDKTEVCIKCGTKRPKKQSLKKKRK